MHAVAVNIAISGRTILFPLVSHGKLNRKDAVLAAQVFRFGNRAANGGARAGVRRNFLGLQGTLAQQAENYQIDCDRKLLHF